MDRRQFLGTTAAALASGPLSLAASESARPSPKDNPSPVVQRKPLPVGVFNPPFRNLSLDQMLAKFSSLGIEAAEIGAGDTQGHRSARSPTCWRTRRRPVNGNRNLLITIIYTFFLKLKKQK